MVARTFETLVNDFIDEYDIGGGGPLETLPGQTHAVIGQSGILKKAVRWIRDSNDSINNLWKTWRFLWFEHNIAAATPGLAASSRAPAMPTFEVRQWDRSRFLLNKGLATHSMLLYKGWDEFFPLYEHDAPLTGTRPAVITILPNRTLRVDAAADQAYGFYGQGWKAPTRLTIDSSTPDLPESFDRIIIVRAAIYYADKEDVPEVLEGAQAEYLELLQGLQSAELDSIEYETMDHQDVDLVFGTPGGGSLGTTR